MSETHAPYQRPRAGSDTVAEIEIKRSRFITLLRMTPTEEDARAFIAEVRHRYPDARHHCSAFIIHHPDAQPVERSSDDGEPAGTAGQPMLDVLRGSGLRDITAVVVRYFGGIKLGTGGLVRAYQDAVRAGLGEVPVTTRRHVQRCAVDVPLADAGRLDAEFRQLGIAVVGVDYATKATIHLAVDDVAALRTQVASLTGGSVEVRITGSQWIDEPHS